MGFSVSSLVASHCPFNELQHQRNALEVGARQGNVEDHVILRLDAIDQVHDPTSREHVGPDLLPRCRRALSALGVVEQLFLSSVIPTLHPVVEIAGAHRREHRDECVLRRVAFELRRSNIVDLHRRRVTRKRVIVDILHDEVALPRRAELGNCGLGRSAE